jgi:LmbE family N-acetylglucosaminyl deacetylase
MSIRPATSSLPLLAPHHQVHPDGLRIFGDHAGTLALDPQERAVLAACDGTRTVRQLGRDLPGAARVIAKHRAAGVVVLLEPLARRPRPPRWLVVSPHQDDAALSVGGWLYAERNRVEPVILGLTTQSRSCAFLPQVRDAGLVTAWRRTEDAVYARFLGATLVECGLPDTSLRRTLEDRGENHWSPPGPDHVRRFQRHIARAAEVHAPAVVLAPLGVGRHTDHLAAHDATLRWWRAQEAPPRLFFYEDVPYAHRDYLDVFRRLDALRTTGARLRPRVVPIDDVLDRKLEGILVYRSQVPWRFREAAADYARWCGAESGLTGARERVWELVRA